MEYTACLRACMAAYRKLRGPGGGEAEIGESGERKKLDEDEEDAEEAAARERASHGGTGKDTGPTTKKRLAATHSRCTKDGKVEEHPLEPVRLLGACSEPRPGEARRRIFATLVLACPPSASYFERARNIQTYDRNNMKRSICISINMHFAQRFAISN